MKNRHMQTMLNPYHQKIIASFIKIGKTFLINTHIYTPPQCQFWQFMPSDESVIVGYI